MVNEILKNFKFSELPNELTINELIIKNAKKEYKLILENYTSEQINAAIEYLSSIDFSNVDHKLKEIVSVLNFEEAMKLAKGCIDGEIYL